MKFSARRRARALPYKSGITAAGVVSGLVISLALVVVGCLPVESRVDLAEAYSEIGAAIDFKRRECGHMPAYPLVIPGRPSEYGVRLCSLTILRQSCPFRDYPIFCLEIYTEECDQCNLPLIGP